VHRASASNVERFARLVHPESSASCQGRSQRSSQRIGKCIGNETKNGQPRIASHLTIPSPAFGLVSIEKQGIGTINLQFQLACLGCAACRLNGSIFANDLGEIIDAFLFFEQDSFQEDDQWPIVGTGFEYFQIKLDGFGFEF